MSKRRVVITGLGVVAPNGVGVQDFWRNVRAGVSGIKPYAWGQAFGMRSRVMGSATDFNATTHGVAEIAQQGYGRYLQFALAAGRMALQDAGLGSPQARAALDASRVGVCVASAIADAASMEANLVRLTDGGRAAPDPALVGTVDYDHFDFGLAASVLAREVGAGGSVTNLSTGCTAGVDALGYALDQIRSGAADLMLAGASEAPLCPLSVGSFEALGALSTRDTGADPAAASCPYTAHRDGFVIAEGCGILVLEALDHALARGATVYAELAGYASVNNAYHMTDLPPDGESLAQCIRLALRDADCASGDVDHISAHGSSTPQNDVNETGAVKAVFGAHASMIALNSMKSMTGHALAAANAVEAVALSLEIRHQVLHPTINYSNPDPLCDLDYVPNKARASGIRAALKLSSGFSGIHSALVMKAVQS
jgi:3-oxoacyl-(acyl-carrier-protein) synthase